MALSTPITLSGDKLGQRQQHLNSLVREAYDSGASFKDVETLPEHSAIDRLFKIDLAIKLKNVDYILGNLKDSDMLYVSKALKSPWLLDHHDFINPTYLEDVLFPEMITPAISKMKHWLYINLRNPSTCEEFYKFYEENAFEFAIKFLVHCNNEFILSEVQKILIKITTHQLKVLSEKCPKVAKIYFDSLATDVNVRTHYLGQEEAYYNSVKCILKLDADLFLDITEKYFKINKFSRFSSSATDYILRYHKNRFTNKLELYVAHILHMPTLAARLSVEECQEVVIKLARADYLKYWFDYKVVEPLVKRLHPDIRSDFKKRVFVDKDVGELISDWPYEKPTPPKHLDPGPQVFDDQDLQYACGMPVCRPMVGGMLRCSFKYSCKAECIPMKTELDRLFDEYRFIGFNRALYEFKQRLGATGSADRRRDFFLVLVSKSGGRCEAVSELLTLAARHSNEPAHTRASVLRSLVKRANVWRLPASVWQNFLDFGHDLGLDGAFSEVVCHEGIYAVVIRQLLANNRCEPAICTAFLKDFSTLTEYSLTPDERSRVAIGLQNMLTKAASDAKPEIAAERLDQLLDVLKSYRIRIEPTSLIVKEVMALALRDAKVARPLLERLYNARVGRRELLRFNMEFRRDEAALVNALRHEPLALDVMRVVEITATGETRIDRFASKLMVYFDEEEGLASKLHGAIKEKICQEFNAKLARPLASLIGKNLEMELHKQDAAGKERVKLSAALRACAHRARPVIDVTKWGWKKAGVKAIATRAMCCRELERAGIIRALGVERRTVRVALALSMRSDGELLLDTFAITAKLRPTAALRAAIQYYRHHGAQADPRICDIVKPLISSVDLSSRERLRRLLSKTDWIPASIKPDYCASLYLVIDKISTTSAEYILRDLSNLLPDLSEESIENILLQMLDYTDKDTPSIPCPGIFIRYLMLSKNDEDLQKRLKKIGQRFLDRLDTLRSEKDSTFPERLKQVMESLKYNAAFLDVKFTSCLSVVERILTWMQTFMPKEEYFKQYVQLHLTMLYFKAVRQSMKQIPEVFADPKRKLSEGVEAVGFCFGRYIMKEVSELVDTYFDSIIELYTGALVNYLDVYFMYGSSRAKFVGYVLKGIMTEGVGNQRRIAVYVLRNRRYDMEEPIRKEIEDLMINDKAIEHFVHAELFT